MRKPPTFVIALFSVLTIGGLATRPSAQTSTSADTQDVVAADSQDAAAVEADAADPTAKFRRALARHRPLYRFDEGEDYFPLAVNAITNNPGNELRRDNDDVIARRANGGGLTIRYLHRGTYPNGDDVKDDDKLFERHGSDDPDADYARDAARLYNNRSLRNRIYGRISYRVSDPNGRIIGAWLQYWVFYYYNSFAQFGIGKHEGDWETIQIQVDNNANPVRAAYAQHTTGSLCNWNHIERVGSGGARPVVYVGGGSHASYYKPGPKPNGDRANGRGKRLSGIHLRPIDDDRPRWLTWPGHWGSTPDPVKSPNGPAFQRPKWDNPDQWARDISDTDHCR